MAAIGNPNHSGFPHLTNGQPRPMGTSKADTPFRLRRIYDPVEDDGGRRVLIDRLWPRGISKERAHLDDWAKDVAPSTELRNWFHADPDKRFPEFAKRYDAELGGPAQQDAIAGLRDAAAHGPVTLLTAVKDPDDSYLSVLLKRLE